MWAKIVELWARHEKLVIALFFAFAALYPVLFPAPYLVNVGILCIIFVVLSISLNLITGFMGQVTLGHAAFYGIGAYTAAILATRIGMGFLGTAMCAIVVSALFGLLLGMPTMRLSGNYLAIATMAFGEIARLVELNWIGLTRGPLGIPAIPPPRIFGYNFESINSKYYLILVIAILTMIVVDNLINSRPGRCLLAIKGDSVAAEAMGINVFKYKLLCFAISSAIAGLAGAFYAHYMSYIDPTSFAGDTSTQILSMTILGGLGSIPGSIFGAVVLTALPELLRELMDYRQIIYGVILVVMVLVKSDGLLGGINLRHVRQRLGLQKAKEGGAGK